MYTNISSSKITYASLLALIFLSSISLTFLLRENIVRIYDGTSENLHEAVLSVESWKYNFAYDVSGNKNYLAALGSVFSSIFSKSSNQTALSATNAVDIPVLVYHGMVSKPDRFSMTTQTFSDQMFALKKAGYRTITMDDFIAFTRGQKELPDKSFLLTFDDGRTDSWVGADPILKATGFHAVMFVATGDSLNPGMASGGYYLNIDDLKAMIRSGRWELGSHAIQANTLGGEIPVDANGTLGNFLSNKMYLKDEGRLETTEEYTTRIVHELTDSKTNLENTFGISVNALSYPFSDFGEQTLNNPDAIAIISSIMHQEYSVAFQQTWPSDSSFILNYSDMDPFHMRRIETGTTWSGQYLLDLLETGRAKSLPYVDTFATDNGWRDTWGNVGVTPGSTLHMESTASTTGAFGFLDGTREYTDYMYSTEVSLQKGSRISLFARFTDTSNNVACVFGPENVRIEQRLLGNTTILAQAPNPVDVAYPAASLSILVQGGVVRCFEGSHDVASSPSIDSRLSHGGVALQVWDAVKGNASLDVSSVNIVASSDASSLEETLPNYPLKK